jgi:hypothetical protein
VATSLNNLATLLRAQGKYDEAEPLYRQSLTTWRKVCAIHLAASPRDLLQGVGRGASRRGSFAQQPSGVAENTGEV